MKKIIPNQYTNLYKNSLFITNYEVNRDSIKINYSNGKFRIVPYSKEKEIEILNTMKEQVLRINEFKDTFYNNANQSIEYSMLMGLLAVFNASLFMLDESNIAKLTSMVGILVGSGMTGYLLANAKNNEDALNEIKKYKYFLDNEDTINHEITLNYFDFYGKDADIEKANRITLNDIDNYTLDDLEAIVELIKSSDEYKLEHKRA